MMGRFTVVVELLRVTGMAGVVGVVRV